VAIINQGRLLAIDSPSGLQRASEQTNRVLLTASAPADALRTALLSISGVTAVAAHPVPGIEGMLDVECQTDSREDVEPAIARAVAARWNLHRLERQRPTLENIFLRYVSQPDSGRAPQ
jgi:ABC-type multidrug transport system ATPase subunit